MNNIKKLLLPFLLVLFFTGSSFSQENVKQETGKSIPSKLAVLWTSGDRDVALKMVFMYTFYAKERGWWQDIQFIVWGPSSKLLSEDKELQDYIKKMKDKGVEIVACKACADSYGVSGKLEDLGIEVKYMGMPLTELLKSEKWKVVTF
jgi:hypothetical protein